jgi:hypothetical protein
MKREMIEWGEVHLKVWDNLSTKFTNTAKNNIDFKVYYDVKRFVEQDNKVFFFNLRRRVFNILDRVVEESKP